MLRFQLLNEFYNKHCLGTIFPVTSDKSFYSYINFNDLGLSADIHDFANEIVYGRKLYVTEKDYIIELEDSICSEPDEYLPRLTCIKELENCYNNLKK